MTARISKEVGMNGLSFFIAIVSVVGCASAPAPTPATAPPPAPPVTSAPAGNLYARIPVEIAAYVLSVSDTTRLTVGEHSLLESFIATPIRYPNGVITVDIQYLYLIDGKFVKVRATIPEPIWQQSRVPIFARELARRMAGGIERPTSTDSSCASPVIAAIADTMAAKFDHHQFIFIGSTHGDAKIDRQRASLAVGVGSLERLL